MTEPFNLNAIRAVLFDMDGVLHRGEAAQPFAAELLRFLEAQGVALACVTNNSTLTPEEHQGSLAGMGMDISASRILTSALVTRCYLEQIAPLGSRLSVIGMSGLYEALLGDGYFRADTLTPEFVVVGLDLGFTYHKGRDAARAILGGAAFIGTNGDALRPTEQGVEPEAGAILAFLEAATGIAPTIIGKPGPLMFEMALERLGVHPHESLVVGDNLHTDVAGAKAAGIASVLVMNGVTSTRALAAHPQKPTWAVSSLEELLRSWHVADRVVRSA